MIRAPEKDLVDNHSGKQHTEWQERTGFIARDVELVTLFGVYSVQSGENVAVLLDGEQSAALGSLSFAKDLEVVFESEPLPAFVACAIGDRLDDDDEAALFAALLELDDEKGGADVLEQIRLVRFETLSDVQIDQIESVRERVASR